MWIFLAVFQFVTFSVVLESREECEALGRANIEHWAYTGQSPEAYCMRTAEV